MYLWPRPRPRPASAGGCWPLWWGAVGWRPSSPRPRPVPALYPSLHGQAQGYWKATPDVPGGGWFSLWRVRCGLIRTPQAALLPRGCLSFQTGIAGGAVRPERGLEPWVAPCRSAQVVSPTVWHLRPHLRPLWHRGTRRRTRATRGPAMRATSRLLPSGARSRGVGTGIEAAWARPNRRQWSLDHRDRSEK